MNCKACQIEIAELNVAAQQSKATIAHINSCTTCRTFQSEHFALKGMINSLGVVTAPADFDFRLRARLATLKGEQRRSVTWSRLSPASLSLAIAAALVVVVLVGIVARQMRQNTGGDINQTPIVKSNEVDTGGPAIDRVPAVQKSEEPEGTIQPRENIATAGATPRTGTSSRAAQRSPNGSGTRAADEQEIRSVDMASTATASSVLPPGIPDPLTLSGSSTSVPLRTSMQPATFVMNTGHSSQTISVRTVTFGRQDIFEPANAARGVVPTVQGVW